ncbi:hypothetical protein Pma05_34240 [Plantactinospora mayteni]|uniref:Uncharacterized protein n=1 Tax=Plantactinospora mayteni TaxID=566021 RepID=A0ABQ4EQB6_9ACTN|nr:hypothetical protein Pma05_34240 [Plantactinospora mayteni]
MDGRTIKHFGCYKSHSGHRPPRGRITRTQPDHPYPGRDAARSAGTLVVWTGTLVTRDGTPAVRAGAATPVPPGPRPTCGRGVTQ